MRNRRTGWGIWRAVLGTWCMVAGLLLGGMAGAFAEPAPSHVRGLSVVKLTPVSRTALASGQFDFTYRVTLRNETVGAYDIQAELATTDRRYDIRDRKASWDLLPSGAQAESAETVTVRAPAAFDARLKVGQALWRDGIGREWTRWG